MLKEDTDFENISVKMSVECFFIPGILASKVFQEYSFPDLAIIAIPAKSTQFKYRLISHYLKLFFSKALCHPDFTYNIDQGNSRLIRLCKDDTQEI